MAQLQVTVLRAHHLKDTDFFGSEHVYVLLRIGDNVQRTETRKGTHPHFGDAFLFLPPFQSQELQVEVWSQHTITGDRLVGRGVFPLVQAMRAGSEATFVPLHTTHGHQHGELEIALSYLGAPAVAVAPTYAPAPAYAAAPAAVPMYAAPVAYPGYGAAAAAGAQMAVLAEEERMLRREERREERREFAMERDMMFMQEAAVVNAEIGMGMGMGMEMGMGRGAVFVEETRFF